MKRPEPSPEDSPDFADLERRLARLTPAAPSPLAERRFLRHLDELSIARREARQRWWRFAPVAAAACLVLLGVAVVRPRLAEPAARTVTEAPAAPAATDPRNRPADPGTPPPVVTGIPADHFLPVSAQEFLRETTPGGIVEGSDRRPLREIRVEYDKAWHWHDPATQTNIRIFSPREEVILVPIETD